MTEDFGRDVEDGGGVYGRRGGCSIGELEVEVSPISARSSRRRWEKLEKDKSFFEDGDLDAINVTSSSSACPTENSRSVPRAVSFSPKRQSIPTGFPTVDLLTRPCDVADCFRSPSSSAVTCVSNKSSEGAQTKKSKQKINSPQEKPSEKYNAFTPPSQPKLMRWNPYNLSKKTRTILKLTELPFLIMWVYAAYFLTIVAFTAKLVDISVWLSALLASLLVGVGLNANAAHVLTYNGSLDIGMMLRFFAIPFGVSALSGLSHGLRDEFLLVFPKDPLKLSMAISVPAGCVTLLVATRLLAIRKHKIPLNARNALLNGHIYT